MNSSPPANMSDSFVSAIRALPPFGFKTPTKSRTVDPRILWAPERPGNPVARQLFNEPEPQQFANMVPHDQNNGYGHRNK
jgi:hypothetical protein